MKYYEYEVIEPVMPGKHVDGWKATRKKQWKYIRETLKEDFIAAACYVPLTLLPFLTNSNS